MNQITMLRNIKRTAHITLGTAGTAILFALAFLAIATYVSIAIAAIKYIFS